MLSDTAAKKLNLGGVKRHMMICLGPKCCPEDRGLAVWEHLKQRLKETGLVNNDTASLSRTKVKCLRVCCDGPVAVVYPEGTWYRLVDEQAIDTIIAEHLVNGRPVAKYAFAQTTLTLPGSPI